jgi:hypothetical protein
MTTIILGNPNPIHFYPVGPRPAEHLSKSETRVEFWDGIQDEEFVNRTLSTDNDRMITAIASRLGNEHRIHTVCLRELEQILDIHSAGVKPAWVDVDEESDRPLAEAVAAYYGCLLGRPEALLTTVGRDAVHAQVLSTSTPPATFNWMAITTNTASPSASDTTLAGEITTSGSGLVRAQATYAHTAGTNISTLTKTFTTTSSDASSLPLTIAQMGVFNASSGGTLIFHTALSGTANLAVVGDNVTVTETVTAG